MFIYRSALTHLDTDPILVDPGIDLTQEGGPLLDQDPYLARALNMQSNPLHASFHIETHLAHIPSGHEEVERLEALRETFDPLEIATRYRRSMTLLEQSDIVVGRRELFSQTAMTLPCREHQLLLGEPGLAKSLYVETVYSLIEGANVFKIQLTKGTPEEALVGPLDISKLKQGVYQHNVTGSLIEADFAFLDELFNANDHALLSLNSILHERKFQKGAQQVVARLQSALATSNVVRYNAQTEAAIDRFISVAYLSPLENALDRVHMARSHNRLGGNIQKQPPIEKVTLPEFDFLCDVIAENVDSFSVTIPAHHYYLQDVIVSKYLESVKSDSGSDGAEARISDRTRAKAMRFAKASAILNGRTQVSDSDLEALGYTLAPLGHPDNYTQRYMKIASEVLSGIKASDRDLIDSLLTLSDDIRTLESERILGTRSIDPTVLERIALFCRTTSVGAITFQAVSKALKDVHPTHKAVHELRELVEEKLALAKCRVDKKNDDLLVSL